MVGVFFQQVLISWKKLEAVPVSRIINYETKKWKDGLFICLFCIFVLNTPVFK